MQARRAAAYLLRFEKESDRLKLPRTPPFFFAAASAAAAAAAAAARCFSFFSCECRLQLCCIVSAAQSTSVRLYLRMFCAFLRRDAACSMSTAPRSS